MIIYCSSIYFLVHFSMDIPFVRPVFLILPSCFLFDSKFLVAVPCPPLSEGLSVPAGCRCAPGLNGTVMASNSTPYYISSCSHVPCPRLSQGVNVFSGCQVAITRRSGCVYIFFSPTNTRLSHFHPFLALIIFTFTLFYLFIYFFKKNFIPFW